MLPGALIWSGPVASIGPLVPADEMLVHQIADTFATVGQSDRSWTEKIWAMAPTGTGRCKLVFGLGVYPNRGVIDAFGGVSRGVEQWTVRSSSRLGRDPSTSAGRTVRYEVVEPLKQIRFTLDPNPRDPDLLRLAVRGRRPSVVGAQRAAPRRIRKAYRGRRCRSVPPGRYRRADGQRSRDLATTSPSLDWVSARDHSWGVRYGVGCACRGRGSRARHERRGVTGHVVPASLRGAGRLALRDSLVLPATLGRGLETRGATRRDRACGWYEEALHERQAQARLHPDNRRFVEGRSSSRWRTARSGPSSCDRSPRPGSISAPGSIWATEVTGTANGEGKTS